MLVESDFSLLSASIYDKVALKGLVSFFSRKETIEPGALPPPFENFDFDLI